MCRLEGTDSGKINTGINMPHFCHISGHASGWGKHKVSEDKRKHPRRVAHLEVELSFPSGEKQIVRTRDISEGGVFVLLDKLRHPMIGEVVTVVLNDNEQNAGEVFPSSDAVVVRQEEGGIGLAFIEFDFVDGI
ncbi:MAG TPA: PilZ domain-containing protein [Gammaproteobacteria bacterium]|nr:PilZ domain-containing protein [Gammaproteobacteria bacterium]